MGSCTNYSTLARFVDKNGVKLVKEWEEKLLGKRVVDCSETEIFHWVKNEVTLDNGDSYETHFRWATQAEEESKIENMSDDGVDVLDEDDRHYNTPMKQYFEKYILGRQITQVGIGYEREDYVYIFIAVGNEDIKHSFDIPLISVDDITDEEVA